MRARQAAIIGFIAAAGCAAAACDDLRTHPRSAAPADAQAPPPAAAPVVAAAPATDPALAATPTAATPTAPSPTAPTPTGGAPATPPSRDLSTANLHPRSIEAASLKGGDQNAMLVKVETLLDRAHASPGAIDGLPGGNLTSALAAYEKEHNLGGAGALTPQVVSALEGGWGQAPITQTYVITAQDEKGPFLGKAPTSFVALAKLPHLGWTNPAQELSERFHMSEGLLRAMNPGADLSAVGTSLVVVRPGDGQFQQPVSRIEVDKAANQVRVLDAGGQIVATFPATVGSTERPAPTGTYAVKAVTPNPDYVYNPKQLTFGPKKAGVLTLKPGPNNPVGTTWIGLTLPTYGIHGSPDPTLIGKTASHGCVRLTNWDAASLGKAVKKGIPVVFVGQTSKS